MSRRSTQILLFDLVHHAERVRDVFARFQSTDAFVADSTAKDAVLWNFVVLGEVCVRLGEPFQEAHPEIPWRGIIDHRNLLAHGYDILDWGLLVEVISNHIPVLIREARQLLAAYGPPPQD